MLTNEEKRVDIYTTSDKPTNPADVDESTPLECLNLNWREIDLPERVRTKHVHRLHPYLGKYIPQLVEILLRKFFKPGQTVLDPFCGSGTTLVQANELGINSIGYDISAFNVLLSSVKVAKYDLDKVRDEVFDILELVRSHTQTDPRQPGFWDNDQATLSHLQTDDQYLLDWYSPRALSELLTYLYYINARSYEYKNLLKIILSRSARSARLAPHYELDFPKHPQTEPYRCYKHSRTCYPTSEAFKFLKRYSLDTLRRIEQFSQLCTKAKCEIYHADSRRATFPPLDGVITSPPYVGLIDYHDQHSYAYHLFNLEDKRIDEIGPASNGSSQRAQQQYQQDIAAVFRNAIASMQDDGYLIIVANDRSNLYDEIAELCKVKVEAVIKRHVNRRTGRRNSAFFESIFIWRKG